MLNPLIGMPEGAEWLVILAIVILVFGAAKLPDLARSSGQALRIFKAETKGLREGDKGKGTVEGEVVNDDKPEETR
jgi:sec-independent protein translocase protein TatA